MAAVAHTPAFTKKTGIPQSVGEEFVSADKYVGIKSKGKIKNYVNGKKVKNG